jgi:hypothetical protein
VIEEPHTHPIPPTLRRNEASQRCRNMVADLWDVIRYEEALHIGQAYLDAERSESCELEDWPLLSLLD